jgi:predicted protein tyrosine phosphatase
MLIVLKNEEQLPSLLHFPPLLPQHQLNLSFTDIKLDYQTKIVFKDLYSFRKIEKIFKFVNSLQQSVHMNIVAS